jgi:hypothetical protein
MKTLKITGGTLTDKIFEVDAPHLGNVMWNATQALRDAVHGKFGEPLIETWHNRRVTRENLDMKKVEVFRRMPEVLDAPAICVGVIGRDGHEHRVFIDGNHRVAARILNKTYDQIFWLIPTWEEQNYRVTMEVVDE